MSTIDRPDWEALARYLADESPDDERAQVRAWLGGNPEDAKVVEALDRMLDGVRAPVPAGLDVEGALARSKAEWEGSTTPGLRLEKTLAPRVRGGVQLESPPRKRGTGVVAIRTWYQSSAFRIAAVLGIAALGTAIWRGMDTAVPAQVVEMRIHRAAAGKPDSVNLPDGSQVVLAPGSELGVPADYGSEFRQVALKGLGWFKVTHDDARPFLVKSGGAEIRDVGTIFTVREIGDRAIRVSVHEGAVLVKGEAQSADREVLLHEGDEAVVAAGALASTTRGTLRADDAEWVSGRLRFMDVSLAEVAANLGRWYGVEIRVTDSTLGTRKVTTEVNGGDVEGVLRDVALALGARLERRGDTLVVR